ncbi:tyrosine-protein phosphatase non-receptor type 23-like [Limulus polyphemus]|uniref:Tyrosine-protein phosphatase non-receptor type 23-like n=1 Tax=Limulus polyphemus TaxID=6850 RepID=A0ABM1S4P4_LIMPO|nr:tyrosine-protein phosphatase non-receptor type 23-like [Limulus polyphemus]
MEAVPRLPMLSCELKISPSPSDFGPPLKKFIRDHYHEDPESYNKEIKELESLRQSACKVPRDFTGCSTLKRYYSQLLSLQNRFPMAEDGPASVPFVWSDIFSGLVFSITDIKYEQACILYNIGALHSELGAMDSRHNAEGMKIACTHFQCAAWAFQHLRDNFPQPKGSDMSHDLLTFFINIMLAQAQECILEKSMLDSRKSSITAKVAAQVVEYYKISMGNLMAGGSNMEPGCILDIVGGKTFKTWKKFLEFKMAYYACISHLYMGNQAEDQQKMGERVSWYQSAQEKLEAAAKIAKSIEREDLNDALTFTMDVVGGKQNAAKKENDFVYHEKVLPVESLPEIKGASLVKGIPFSPSDPDVSGPDIFARLVPMEAHEAASLYSEEKAKLLRAMAAKIEDKDQELLTYMSSLQLDISSLKPETEKIPQELLEKCAAFSVKPTALKDLTDLMENLTDISREVENILSESKTMLTEEEEKEKHHQVTHGKRAPSMITCELMKECEKYQVAHKRASESNATLHKALSLHLDNLKLLTGPLEELQKALPSVSLLDVPNSEGGARELEKLHNKVEEMRCQRSMLESQLREAVQNDDITKLLVTRDKNDDLQKLFDEELKKHSHLLGLLEQNLAAQDNILRALTQAHARYADTRKATEDVLQRRKMFVLSLLNSCEAYDDLLAKSEKGLDFYKKLQNNAARVLARVKSVISVQDEERTQLSQVQYRKGRSGGYGSPIAPVTGPKLKDFLPYMTGHSLPPVGTSVGNQGPGSSIVPSVGTQPQVGVITSQVPPSLDPSRGVMPPEVLKRPSQKSVQEVGKLPLGSQPNALEVSKSSVTMEDRPAPVGSEQTTTTGMCVTSSYTSVYSYDYYKQASQNVYPQSQQIPQQPASVLSQHGQQVGHPYLQGLHHYDVQASTPSTRSARENMNKSQLTHYENYSKLQQPQHGTMFSVPSSGDIPTTQTVNIPYRPPQSSKDIHPQYQQSQFSSGSSSQHLPSQYQPPQPSGGIHTQYQQSQLAGVSSTQTFQDCYQLPQSSGTTYPQHHKSQPTSGPSLQPLQPAYQPSARIHTQYQQPQFSGASSTQTFPTQYQYPQPSISSTQPLPSQYQPSGVSSTQPLPTQYQPVQPSGVPSTQPLPTQYHYPQPSGVSSTQHLPTHYKPSQPAGISSTQSLPIQYQYSQPSNVSFTPNVTTQYQYSQSLAGSASTQTLPKHYPYSQPASDSSNQSLQSHYQHPQPTIASQLQPAYGHGQFLPYSVGTQNVPHPIPQQSQGAISVAPSAQQLTTGYSQAYQYSNVPGGTLSAQLQDPYYQYPYYQQYQMQGQQVSSVPSLVSQQHPQHQTTSIQQPNVQQEVSAQPHPDSLGSPLQPLPASTPQSPVKQEIHEETGKMLSNRTPLDTPSKTTAPFPVPCSPAHSRQSIDSISDREDLLSSTPETGTLNKEQQPVLQPEVISVEELKLKKQQMEQEKQLHLGKDPLSDPVVLDRFITEVEKFEKYVEGLTRKNLNGTSPLDQKWKDLENSQERDPQKCSISVARCYPMKNRYPDIMPYDKNRVQLTSLRNDYINASYVLDITPMSPKFIVTQSPLSTAYGDFWTMVWEQQAEVVICLQSNQELNPPLYWPTERGQSIKHGPVTINLQSCKEKQLHVERVINITHVQTKISRVIIHMHYTTWLPSGMPSNPQLLQFVNEVHSYYQQQRSLAKPVIVHCSGGIGRSGVFCLVFAAVREMAAGHGPLDIVKVASIMNQQRKYLLQEKEQLKFCYETVLYHAQDLLMKRGILTNKGKFQDKLQCAGSGRTHTRHPSEDFILGGGGLSKLQSDMAKLEVQEYDSKVEEPSKIDKSEEHDSKIEEPSQNQEQFEEVVSSSTGQIEETPGENILDSTGQTGLLEQPKVEIGDPRSGAFSSDGNVSKASEEKPPTEPSEGENTQPSPLTSLLDPARFSLDPVVASPSKQKITKDSFLNPSGSLSSQTADPSDPFSQLDPLWSLKKDKK